MAPLRPPVGVGDRGPTRSSHVSRHDHEGHGCEREQRLSAPPSPRGRHSSSHGLPRRPQCDEPDDRQQRDLRSVAGNRPTVTDPHRVALGTGSWSPTRTRPPGSRALPCSSHPASYSVERNTVPSTPAPSHPPGTGSSAVADTTSPHLDRGRVGRAEDLDGRPARSRGSRRVGAPPSSGRSTKPDAGTRFTSICASKDVVGSFGKGPCSATTKRMPNGARRAPP